MPRVQGQGLARPQAELGISLTEKHVQPRQAASARPGGLLQEACFQRVIYNIIGNGRCPYSFETTGKNLGPHAAGATAIAYDIVYNPLKTRFLQEAARAGRRCLTGLDMFFGQGDAQFRLWTGQPLP